MKRKNIILFLCLLFSILALPLKVAEAKEGEKIDTYQFKWEEDVVIRGEEQYTKNFYVTQNMEVFDAKLSLKLKASPTLIEELSSLTIIVNDVEVDSKTIDQIKEKERLDLSIPDNLIYKGVNTVTVKAFLKSTREECEINNDINWLSIRKGSELTFSSERTDSKSIQSLFESTYYLDGLEATVPIVLPNKLEEINYLQLTNLSASLGHHHRGKEADLKLVPYTYDDLPKLNQEAIIIGTVDQLKSLDSKILTDKEWKKAKENGFIGLKDHKKMQHFFLITNKEEEIIILNKVLGDKNLLSQLKTDAYLLDEKDVIETTSFNTNPTLKELGYEENMRKGSVENTFNYYFSIPGNKQLGDKNKVSLAYKYPSSMVGENANILISINGDKLFTKEISPDLEEDVLEFSIPEKYSNQTSFNLSLKYNLNPEKTTCLSRMDDQSWIEIDSEQSILNLDLKTREKYTLANSHAFVENGQGQLEKNIVIDNFDHIEIESLLVLTEYLGRISQGVNRLFVIENDFDPLSSDFIIGLNSSPLIKEMADGLRVPISQHSQFYNKELFIQKLDSLAGIQLNQRKETVVISSTDKTQLNEGIEMYPFSMTDEETVIIQGKKIIFSAGEESHVNDRVTKGVKVSNEIKISLLTLVIGLTAVFFFYKKI